MKGLQGLIIAIGLGIIGALCNFAYLAVKSQDVERVAFIGIRPEVEVRRGENLLKDHLVRVELPAKHVGNLDKFAYSFDQVESVVGFPVWRTLQGGSLLLRQDIKTAQTELVFGQDTREGVLEMAMGLPIDQQKMVPSLVNPGDKVSFIIPAGFDRPTPAEEDPGKIDPGKIDPTKPIPAATMRPALRRAGASGDPQMIGPFKILSIGNRLTSAEVMRTGKVQQLQESVMVILVRIENGKLDAEATKLVKLLDETNSRPLVYLLHPRTPQGK
jgi:hypothetical protein